ncbi:MAG: hypothetical protein HY291_07160 [Planctomycetes bacterium]|nr:hypothetical protein [Planctomycetota bacterium]
MARLKPADKKKNAKVVSEASAPGVAYSVGEAFGRTVRPLVPITLLAALYAAAAFGLWMPLKKDERATLTRERLLKPMLSNQGRPAWVNDLEMRKIAQLGLATEGRNVFESGVAAQLAHAYETSPWIEQVGAVRVRYPAAVQVEDPRWRVPVARVDCDGGFLVLDRSGCVMPLFAEDMAAPRPPNSPPPRLELPSIAGFRCRRTDPATKVVEAEALEGLEFLATLQEILRRAPGGLRVMRVQRDASGAWRAWVLRGPAINWGFWNDEARPVDEPAAREKKERLAQILSNCDATKLGEIKLNVPSMPVAPR